MSTHILCADIGGSFIDFAAMDHQYHVLHRRKVATPLKDTELFLRQLSDLSSPYPEIPLHIAMTGTQNPQTGCLHVANIPCVDGKPLAQLLHTHLSRPVRIANDADCFVLGEAHFGCAQEYPIAFGIILGTGVGGGLVVHGKLVDGPQGVSGEWGHGPIIPSLPQAPSFQCGCGQYGCLDTVGSARGLERLHQWLGFTPQDSRSIVSLWENGDSEAQKTIALYLEYTSAPLSLMVNTLGVPIIPVGGGLSNAHSLISELDKAVRRRLLRQQETPLLVPGQLGRDAALLGAAALAF